jgi:hypothetical protein
LGLGVIHLIERTELVSGETCVTVCIAVRSAEIVGKMIQEQREREREDDRGRTKQLARAECYVRYRGCDM